jgi:hypothetical protein
LNYFHLVGQYQKQDEGKGEHGQFEAPNPSHAKLQISPTLNIRDDDQVKRSHMSTSDASNTLRQRRQPPIDDEPIQAQPIPHTCAENLSDPASLTSTSRNRASPRLWRKTAENGLFEEHENGVDWREFVDHTPTFYFTLTCDIAPQDNVEEDGQGNGNEVILFDNQRNLSVRLTPTALYWASGHRDQGGQNISDWNLLGSGHWEVRRSPKRTHAHSTRIRQTFPYCPDRTRDIPCPSYFTTYHLTPNLVKLLID